MTRDEILALSDEALNAKVMQIRGWTLLSAVRDTYIVDDVEYEGMMQVEQWVRNEVVMNGTPDFANDIAVAWELTDYLSQLIVTKLIGRWKVEWFDGVRGRVIEEETLPLAITRAFILAMENSGGDHDTR